MVFYITFLKALAACLITNSHYTGVYPTDMIANGGLLGDVLFFAVSGYCLYNIKLSFPRWYGKRLYRIYPPVIIITLIYFVLGFYPINIQNAFQWFIYPTHYHFVASILVVYIVYYIVFKIQVLRTHIPAVMLVVAIAWLIVYLLFFDKSVYKIDNVYSPMIWFLFFEAMLLGAYFKQNDSNYRNRFSIWMFIGLVITFVAYFASKLLFTKKPEIAFLQPINQVLLFVLLYFFLRLFSGLDSKLEKMPKWLKTIVNFIASITLEIYVVQYVIEEQLAQVVQFPMNWLLLTVTILLAAIALHWICKGFYYICDKLQAFVSSKIKKGNQ